MKKVLLISTIIIAAGIQLFAQNGRRPDALEAEIRKLDAAQAEAILRKDFEALDRLCAKDFIVNSPRNNIVKGRDGVKELIRQGVIDYGSFTREIEMISIYEKTVIVIGREMIVTKAGAGQTEQSQLRRYTNVWIKRGGRWLLSARHASIIPPTN